jgi:nucleotide-binding universal stress UspA family protein
MSIVVAFAGSERSHSAFERSCEIQESVDEELVVVTAIPTNTTTYARRHGWIEAGEAFAEETIRSRSGRMVNDGRRTPTDKRINTMTSEAQSLSVERAREPHQGYGSI